MDLTVTASDGGINQTESNDSSIVINTDTKAAEVVEVPEAATRESTETSLTKAATTSDTGSQQPQLDGSPTTINTEAAKSTGAAEVAEVAEATTQDTPENFAAKQVLPKKLCGICNKKEAKYKCSRCALPFCSVACSTIHKATHPATETKPAPSANSRADLEKHYNVTGPRPGTVAAAGIKGPFAALDESKELQALFKMYPRLPVLLDEINSITLPPTKRTQEGDFRGSRRKEEPWNSDLGLRKGVEALTKARNSDGKDGESLREYSKLVLQILSDDSGQSAADLIQKELAEENARIIERLLQGES